MNIVLDAFGGDYAPEEIVKGAMLALKEDKDVSIILVGKQEKINSILKEYNKTERIEVLNADSIITFDESPSAVI